MSAAVAAPARTRSGSVEALNFGPSCSLPVVTDTYDGFKVGVPTGWDVSALQGLVSVADSAGTEGALLYPALLTRGVTARALFSSFMSYEKTALSKQGDALAYTESAGAAPTGAIDIRAGATVLSGRAEVLVLPLRTAVASQLGVAFAYWAPRAQFSSAARALSEIGSCYQPVRATLFQLYRNIGAFTFAMPLGWDLSARSQDYLELSGFRGAASVVYELWGPFEQGVNLNQPVTTAAQAINLMFGIYKITVTRVLAAYTLPDKPFQAGYDAIEYAEFLGTLNGKPVHCLVNITASLNSAGSSAAGVIRLGIATPSLWNSVNGGLVQMMGSIQHNFSGDLQEIARLNRQWQEFSGQVADFDDELNSQQLVQDPTNGQLYEAPYSAWDPDGPQGAGYYGPNGQLLNPVSRS